jgi:hypothetical protein
VEALDGTPSNGFPVGRPWQVRVEFTVSRRTDHLIVGLGLVNASGVAVWTSWSSPFDLKPGCYSAVFRNDQICLSAGSYSIAAGISVYESTVHYQQDAGMLGIAEIRDGTGALVIGSSSGIIKNTMPVVISPRESRMGSESAQVRA